jgi:hypothetical protein
MAKMRKMNPAAKVMEVASKTSNSGFAAGGATARKDGGRIEGEKGMPNLAKRARGGGVYSSAHSTSGRSGSSDSGHEGE